MSIRFFDKTPEGVVCPHFWILNWAHGCPYDCSYCYLALTHRLRGVTPHFYDWSRIKQSIDRFFETHQKPSLLNTGELADSLMNPGLMEKICDLFETQSTHKVLLLSKGCKFPRENYGALEPTKGTAIHFLYKKKYKQTVVSFTVNAHEVSDLYESAAATNYDRLLAAYFLQHAGYEVRLRIDPIIPLKLSNMTNYSWKTAYRDHVKFIFKIMHVNPARITIGTPRWFPALTYWLKRAGRKDDFFKNFDDAKTLCCDGRYRLRLDVRMKAYAYLIRALRKHGYKGPIGLCKETVQAWRELRMRSEEIKCNCML